MCHIIFATNKFVNSNNLNAQKPVNAYSIIPNIKYKFFYNFLNFLNFYVLI